MTTFDNGQAVRNTLHSIAACGLLFAALIHGSRSYAANSVATGERFAPPFSSLASAEAREAATAQPAPQSISAADVALNRAIRENLYTGVLTREQLLAWRLRTDAERRIVSEKLQKDFSVRITSRTIEGVPVEEIEPANGISQANRERVLINLHGGGFIFGARYEGEVYSIPIACLGRIKVITVDYRMAPEYRFPAASEDVAAVYRYLLRSYRSQNIGIYGCSAGGILTAEAIAWFRAHGLPCPGAIALDSSGGIAGVLGDSLFTAPFLHRGPMPPHTPPARGLSAILDPYFGDSDLKDPLASPAYSAEVLKVFPPTLLISGTRDHCLSDAVYTHIQLLKSGVDAQLLVFEGMEHAFVYDSDLPESRDAYRMLVEFFNRHLGTK